MAVILIFTTYHTAHAGVFSALGSKLSGETPFYVLNQAVGANSQKLALLEPEATLASSARGGLDPQIEDGVALAPVEGFEGSAQATAIIPPNDQISVYVVKEGDSLSQVAEMFGVSVNTIMWANNIKKSTSISEGDVLVILPITGVRHIVKAGETIAKIAKLYSADTTEVANYNALAEGTTLKAGDEIIVPHGVIPAPKAPTKKALVKSKDGSSPSTASKYANLPDSSGYFIQPLVGGRKTQGIHGNNAVDLAASLGTELRAAAAGKFIIARTGGWNGGYGNYVVISHDNGSQTLYAHMLDVVVSPGQAVAQGQSIGHLGSSGNSTGPHVHFEIRGVRNPF